MTLTVGSLFSGSGGFDLGFERAGMTVRWQSEIDKHASAVLRHHWPKVRNYGDVRFIGVRELSNLPHTDAENDRIDKTIESPGGAGTPQGMASELEVPMRKDSTPSRLGRHYKRLTPEQAEQAVYFYESGESIGTIAARFGVTRQSMWDLLRRRTKMRPNLRYGEDNHFHRGGEKADPWAHDVFERALEKGWIVRPGTCEECGESPEPFADGRSAIQGHHDDYNRPLAVRWLCQSCHHEWHKRNAPVERKEVQQELEPVDIITFGFP